MKINNLEKIKLTWNKLFSNVRKTVCDNLFLVAFVLVAIPKLSAASNHPPNV